MPALDSSASIIPIARFGKTYGVQGWIHVHNYCEDQHSLQDYLPWQVKKDQWQGVDITGIKPHGNTVIAKIHGCDSPEAAKAYTNVEIGIPRERLPATESNQYYWSDLVGLQVITTTGTLLGTVDYLFETGANDVLVVKGETTERMLPFVMEHVIKEVDLQQQLITVDWDPEF